MERRKDEQKRAVKDVAFVESIVRKEDVLAVKGAYLQIESGVYLGFTFLGTLPQTLLTSSGSHIVTFSNLPRTPIFLFWGIVFLAAASRS